MIKERRGYSLDDLGGDDLAGTAPRREAVEDDELRLLQGGVPVGLAVRQTSISCSSKLYMYVTSEALGRRTDRWESGGCWGRGVRREVVHARHLGGSGEESRGPESRLDAGGVEERRRCTGSGGYWSTQARRGCEQRPSESGCSERHEREEGDSSGYIGDVYTQRKRVRNSCFGRCWMGWNADCSAGRSSATDEVWV